jgi:hypothetical protein
MNGTTAQYLFLEAGDDYRANGTDEQNWVSFWG